MARAAAVGYGARSRPAAASPMPELPEVETIRRGLAARLEGHRLRRVDQRRPDLRQAMPARLRQRLEGRRVERLDRRAKYLLMRLDDAPTYRVECWRSLAPYVHEYLLEAAREFEPVSR